LTGDNLEGLGADQAAGMAGAMGAEQISGLSSDQAAGMVAAISEDPTQMLELDSDSVAAMAATMDAADLGDWDRRCLGPWLRVWIRTRCKK